MSTRYEQNVTLLEEATTALDNVDLRSIHRVDRDKLREARETLRRIAGDMRDVLRSAG